MWKQSYRSIVRCEGHWPMSRRNYQTFSSIWKWYFDRIIYRKHYTGWVGGYWLEKISYVWLFSSFSQMVLFYKIMIPLVMSSFTLIMSVDTFVSLYDFFINSIHMNDKVIYSFFLSLSISPLSLSPLSLTKAL